MTKVAKKVKVSVEKKNIVNDIEARKEQNASPLPTTDTNAENEDPDHPLTEKAVTSGVNALLQLIKIKKDEEKKTLFNDDPKEILLQVIPIKIPISHRQEIRISLPHPMAIEGSDICLITTDVKKSTKNDHEPTIAYYKSLLQEKKIRGITEIVPIRQLRSEYVPYEMKGRFANLYDMYLVDGRLYGKVTKFLGSRFFKKNKDLIPVKINTSDVKKELEQALTKTVLSVHGKGDSYSVKVGYSHFSAQQLKDNLNEVAVVLAKKFPGGFDNIRKLFIKSGTSMAIPIYLSLKPSNEVPVPVVRPNLPKAYQPVEGELSTVVGGHVTVLPTGEVKVKMVYTEEDVSMGYGTHPTRVEEEEEETDDDDNEDMEVDVAPVLTEGKKRKAVAADDDSSDDDVEAAEDAYVMGIQSQANSAGKSRSKKNKVTPKLQLSKAKKEASPANAAVGLTKNKKLQQVSTGEERGTPSLKVAPKVKPGKAKTEQQSEKDAGQILLNAKKIKATPKVKPGKVLEDSESEMSLKKLKATPKVKPGKVKPEPQSEKRAEEMVSPKKLKATPKVKPGKVRKDLELEEIVTPKQLNATPKVKSGKVKPEPQSEKRAEEMVSPKKLKATPKVKPGKVRKDLELEEMVTVSAKKPKVKPRKVRDDPEAGEMGLQEMIAQLLAGKHEDLDVSLGQSVKSKEKKTGGEDSKSTSKTKTKPTELVRSTAEPQDSKATPKLDKSLKLKKSKRLQDVAMSPANKKTREGSVREDNAVSRTPKALVKSPSTSNKKTNTKKVKSGNKSPVPSKEKDRPTRKSFPRYFSSQSLKLLS